MKHQPQTRAEAERSRYGVWAGHPKGNAFNPKYCAAHTMSGGRGSLPTQCGGKPGNGPDNLYCSAHAREFFPGKTETWYSASEGYGFEIKEVQVSHSTDKFVWLAEGDSSSKSAIRDQYTSYWRTLEQAQKRIRDRANAQIARAEAQIKEAAKAIREMKSVP